MTLYTAADAARELGLSSRTIRRWAVRLALGRRLGPLWVLTTEEVAQIKESAYEQAGNPEWMPRRQAV